MMNTHTVQATPEAGARLESYFNEIVNRRKAGELSDVSQYASRWCEHAARLAITIHAGLHGAMAHQHPLELETADNAVKLAQWFADQQLRLLAKGRHAAAAKVEDEILALLDDRMHGKRLEKEEREAGQPVDYVTARNVNRQLKTPPDAAKALLAGMEADGLLAGENITPPHGGKTTRIYRAVKNPVPG